MSEIVEIIAAGLKDECAKFGDPVHFYVEGEARRRAFPDGAPDPSDDAGWERYDAFTEADDWRILAQAAIDAAKRAGFVLVPVEATPAMIKAGHVGDPLGCDVEDEHAPTVYSKIWEWMVREANPAAL